MAAWYFFKTLREKRFVIRQCKRGDYIPFIKYVFYRFKLSHFFLITRRWYSIPVVYAPYAYWLWTHSSKEKDEEIFFESFLQEGDIVVDCGAHLGTLTIIASKIVKEKGFVYAFEAHPKTFSYALHNIKKNKCHNVVIKNVAVGDVSKKVLITDSYVSDMNAIASEGTILVEMKPLIELLHGIKHVDLLKLDIEGYELQAIISLGEYISQVKAIYFESAERSFNRYEYALSDIIVFLKEHHFTCYFVHGKEIGEEVPVSYRTKKRYENILAIRKEPQ